MVYIQRYKRSCPYRAPSATFRRLGTPHILAEGPLLENLVPRQQRAALRHLKLSVHAGTMLRFRWKKLLLSYLRFSAASAP